MTIRLVLASDETITREALRSLFDQVPEIQIVGEAESLVAAPKMVRELLPEVVLIEVSVPGRAQGLRAAKNIAGQCSKTRVVVLTNNSDLPYVRSMLSVGVSGYLLKNSDASQLFAAVRAVKVGGRFIDPTLGNELVWYAIDRKVRSRQPIFSCRESQIFGSLIRGYTNAQSARVFRLSVKTVETYRLRIYRKLQVRTRAELVEYALANRLFTNKGSPI